MRRRRRMWWWAWWWGWNIFVYLPDVGMECLADVGIEEEEEGNHLRREHVPYCVNYKEFVP
jgi:hypothetical protein